MSGPVTYELRDGVAAVTIDDGKVNAFSITTLTALHEALDRAHEDQAALLVRGREGCFSAGFDLGVFRDQGDRVIEMVRLGATLAKRLLAFPAPVVIGCGGHAIAAGAIPLLAGDFRIAVEGSFNLGFNEVGIGMAMPRFVVELARWRLAPPHLRGALLAGALHSPREALELGFVDRVVAPERLHEAAERQATMLARLDRTAFAITKERVNERVLVQFQGALDAEFPPEAEG